MNISPSQGIGMEAPKIPTDDDYDSGKAVYARVPHHQVSYWRNMGFQRDSDRDKHEDSEEAPWEVFVWKWR